MSRFFLVLARSQQFGLILVTLVLGVLLTVFSGTHEVAGQQVNNFLNPDTLIQILTDTSVFAIIAMGMTAVIVLGGIDLSVGSIYALAGVAMALLLRDNAAPSTGLLLLGVVICLGVGLVCGLINGMLTTTLGVHPFIVTLGTMLIFRGVAFVATKAQSILIPDAYTHVAKATLGLRAGLYPVPAILMIVVALTGSMLLTKSVWGRRVFAIGGNLTAAEFAGLPVRKTQVSVYGLVGLCSGLAALLGASYYGSVGSGDGSTYELYVIASAVVGGASLTGGRGNAVNAALGALLIALMRQAVRTLHFDQNYESIIVGAAIIIAVVIDRSTAQFAQRAMPR